MIWLWNMNVFHGKGVVQMRINEMIVTLERMGQPYVYCPISQINDIIFNNWEYISYPRSNLDLGLCFEF